MIQLEEPARKRLLDEMSGALRSELGARTAYASLAWRLSGTELEGVLRKMHTEEEEVPPLPDGERVLRACKEAISREPLVWFTLMLCIQRSP